MALFFFGCVAPAVAAERDFGLELPHLYAARRHARRLADRMMVSEPDRRDWREWSVEISDGSGRRLSVVPFLRVEAHAVAIGAAPPVTSRDAEARRNG